MSGTNDFLPFCPTDTGTNLVEQADYASDADRTIGNQPGVASSALNNKALRQATYIASQFAQYLANTTGQNIQDNATPSQLLASIVAAFQPVAIRSVTTTDSCTNADSVLLLSGASFTETLFDATLNKGKTLTLIHNGTSLTQAYTLATTSSQTIGGVASGSYVLQTNGERLQIISDGTNWQIVDHSTLSAWTSYTLTIGATTSPPTPASSAVSSAKWRRVGDSIEIEYVYSQTATTGAAAGSGTYLFPIPSGLTIDTTKVSISTNAIGQGGHTVGVGYTQTTNAANTATSTAAYVVPYTTTALAIYASYSSGSPVSLPLSSTFCNPNGNTDVGYSMKVTVPIVGWQP